jgi:hypothetical protein
MMDTEFLNFADKEKPAESGDLGASGKKTDQGPRNDICMTLLNLDMKSDGSNFMKKQISMPGTGISISTVNNVQIRDSNNNQGFNTETTNFGNADELSRNFPGDNNLLGNLPNLGERLESIGNAPDPKDYKILTDFGPPEADQ